MRPDPRQTSAEPAETIKEIAIAIVGVAEQYEWNEHEHMTPSVQTQAEHLLDAAGSPELAKHAIDVAAQHHQDPAASPPTTT